MKLVRVFTVIYCIRLRLGPLLLRFTWVPLRSLPVIRYHQRERIIYTPRGKAGPMGKMMDGAAVIVTSVTDFKQHGRHRP